MKRDEQVGAIYVFDFRKVFDSYLTYLLQKLPNLPMPTNLLQWIGSYLTNRKQQVVVNGYKSRELQVLFGVPQGSVL